MNPMREVRVRKVTLNIGVGEPGDKLEAAYNLMKLLTGRTPVRTKTHKRIPKFNVRPGIAIGVKVTLRNNFDELIKRLLVAKDFTLKSSSFDSNGNVNFGIEEYVHIPGLKYDPKIPMFGMNVTISLERPGYRVKHRRLLKAKIPKNHLVSKEEAIEFMKKNYEVKVI